MQPKLSAMQFLKHLQRAGIPHGGNRQKHGIKPNGNQVRPGKRQKRGFTKELNQSEAKDPGKFSGRDDAIIATAFYFHSNSMIILSLSAWLNLFDGSLVLIAGAWQRRIG